MSVLIKGLKMPRWCNECKFHYWRDSLCEITNKEVDDDASMRGVQPWCPITELPDHGDLVDRDVLRKVMRVSASCNRCERDAYKCEYYDGMTAADVCEKIDDMPVVIPAERNEDGET